MKTALIVLLLCLLPSTNALSQKRPKADQMSAYLLAYFKDATHGLYFALSPDGYSFTDINSGNPIIAGDTIATQKGIRDPHIFRGPDGTFYLAMTDLHIYAKEAGYRSTQWDRDGEQYGWGNNRSLVLMKSKDLINWSHTVIRVNQLFPGLEEIGCAWAPEICYDDKADKLMLHFTMRFKAGVNRIYYTYMNDDFTTMTTKPELLFEYPTNASYIDGNIIKARDKYHLFYVSHDGMPGIKQAVSDRMNSGYVYEPCWCDPEPQACEAPTVFKRIGEEKWVLMYDIYGIQPHNFGFSETTDFVNFTDLGHFNEGVMKATNFASPKHGAIICLTRKEATKLAKYWNLKMTFR